MIVEISNLTNTPDYYVDKIVKVDGIFVIDEETSRWWIQAGYSKSSPRIQIKPSPLNSKLSLSLEKLSQPPISQNYYGYRLYDQIRASVRLSLLSNGEPILELLTTVIHRKHYNMFIGVDGVSLEDVIPENVKVIDVSKIQNQLGAYIDTSKYVRGWLVVSPKKRFAYILPEDLDAVPKDQSLINELARDAYQGINIESSRQKGYKVENIEDLQRYFGTFHGLVSALDTHALYWYSASLGIQSDRLMQICMKLFEPKLLGVYVCPAVVVGTIITSRDDHFAQIQNIESLYIQELSKNESVLKLKNL